jgi:hypothetical protein
MFLLIGLIVFDSSLPAAESTYQDFYWTSIELEDRVIEKAALLVPVEFPGTSVKAFAQLDTGSDATIFYGPVLRKHGIPVDSVSADKPRFRWYGIDDKSGPFEKPAFISWRMDSDNDLASDNPRDHIIGTIGLDLVVGKILVVDFPNARFAVLSDTSEIRNVIPGKAYFVNAVISYNKLYVDIPLGKDTLKSVRFDTGASSVALILPLDFWRSATGLDGDEDSVRRDSVRSWGRYVQTLSAPAREDLLFGPIQISSPTVVHVDWPDPTLQKEKLLGNAPFYDDYIVIVDCIRSKFGIASGSGNLR